MDTKVADVHHIRIYHPWQSLRKARLRSNRYLGRQIKVQKPLEIICPRRFDDN